MLNNMPNTKYNWKLLKAKFMNDPDSDMSLSEFARREKIPKGTLMGKARNDNWIADRSRKHNEIADKVTSEVMVYEADRAKKVKERVYDIVDVFLDGFNTMDEGGIERIRSLSVRDVSELMKMAKNAENKVSDNNTLIINNGGKNLDDMDDQEIMEMMAMNGIDIDRDK